MFRIRSRMVIAALAAVWVLPVVALGTASALADPLPGGSLDPTTINKYETPLVIPPVMNNDGEPDSYDIAVRQFKQQILPGGIWRELGFTTQDFEATSVWSYGPAADPTPTVAPDPASQFNYPAYTVETLSNEPVNVRWINDLVDAKGKFLPHLLPIDQTVHWANPPRECADGTKRTDCAGTSQEHYQGPVPIVTHVHGAHVDPHSDGYPEAWWLPAGVPGKYATSGRLFDDVTGTNPGSRGYADFFYRQDQPATTLWYHDHTLGMTRLNVYAGPAGFWLIRGGEFDGAGGGGILPGPAPVAGQTVLELTLPDNPVRQSIREIPIVIQDRSFDQNGRHLFYPEHRAFFEGVEKRDLNIDFAPEGGSDVLPTWQPEAFFNVIVVNGTAWPQLEVAPALYRFRFLNGCNSRFLWLKFDDTNANVPVWQIGAEQGFLPIPVSLNNDLDQSGDGTAQILMGLAERADVIVDFRGLADGTEVELRNIGPDEPFGGGIPGVDFDAADPDTTGKVMKFVVNATLNGASPTDPTGATPATDPADLALNAEGDLGGADYTRQVSLNENESAVVCVLFDVDADAFVEPIKQVDCATPDPDGTPGSGIDVVPFGPTAAFLGTVDLGGAEPAGMPLMWSDHTGASDPVTVFKVDGTPVTVNVTERPTLDDTEEWEIYNFTADAHPIHLHLVRFQVVNREGADGVVRAPEPWETGYKDTVISYPGEITRVKAKFDIPGLYVWHCHIVEHEDNEMMRPYVVSP